MNTSALAQELHQYTGGEKTRAALILHDGLFATAVWCAIDLYLFHKTSEPEMYRVAGMKASELRPVLEFVSDLDVFTEHKVALIVRSRALSAGDGKRSSIAPS